MIFAILMSLVYGLIWGALWGAIDGFCLIKGFLNAPTPMSQIARGLLAMFGSLILISLFLGGNNIVSMIVALLISFPVSAWVQKNWQGL